MRHSGRIRLFRLEEVRLVEAELAGVLIDSHSQVGQVHGSELGPQIEQHGAQAAVGRQRWLSLVGKALGVRLNVADQAVVRADEGTDLIAERIGVGGDRDRRWTAGVCKIQRYARNRVRDGVGSRSYDLISDLDLCVLGVAYDRVERGCGKP